MKNLKKFAIAIKPVLAASLFVLVGLTGFNLASTKEAKTGEDPADTIKRFLSAMEGTIIFDSTRSGTFGIYQLNPETLTPEVLIDTHLHEEEPDPSPDGSLIVYTVRHPDDKQRSPEVWIARSDGTQRRKLIDSGSFPTFSADGQTVFYSFEDRKVMAFSLRSEESKEIFPRKKKKFRNTVIKHPRVSADGKHISFSSSVPEAWHAWTAPLSKGAPTMIHRGCQATWFPDGERLAWIKRRGTKALAGIMSFNRNNEPQRDVLKDDGPPMGHEYFPTITRDGDYLLYASCPYDQHDHRSAAYAIHVNKMDSGETHMLTFDSSTNRWPKLLARANQGTAN